MRASEVAVAVVLLHSAAQLDSTRARQTQWRVAKVRKVLLSYIQQVGLLKPEHVLPELHFVHLFPNLVVATMMHML